MAPAARRGKMIDVQLAHSHRGVTAVSTELPLPDVMVTTKPKSREQTHTRRIPPYHVILENDDHHSFGFVVEVLCKALGYTQVRAYELTLQAHHSGRAIVWTGPKEVAELKADQIRTFHEIRVPDGRQLGPLGCTIEPAPGG
jgi:ATP-dependent Clp protease adaptor protein ClpS